MKQVITISATGEMSGLQRKKGQGLDLRQFGRAEIQRVSEIVWNEEEQMWVVYILRPGSNLGVLLDWEAIRAASVHNMVEPALVSFIKPEGIPYFTDYEDAVAAEIAYLDHCRLHNKDPLNPIGRDYYER